MDNYLEPGDDQTAYSSFLTLESPPLPFINPSFLMRGRHARHNFGQLPSSLLLDQQNSIASIDNSRQFGAFSAENPGNSLQTWTTHSGSNGEILCMASKHLSCYGHGLLIYLKDQNSLMPSEFSHLFSPVHDSLGYTIEQGSTHNDVHAIPNIPQDVGNRRVRSKQLLTSEHAIKLRDSIVCLLDGAQTTAGCAR
jgi:hypothetical protein